MNLHVYSKVKKVRHSVRNGVVVLAEMFKIRSRLIRSPWVFSTLDQQQFRCLPHTSAVQ